MTDFVGARLYKLFPKPVIAVCLQRDVEQSEVDAAIEASSRAATKALNYEGLEEIKKFIEHNLEVYMREIYSPRNDVTLRVTTSWSNVGSSPIALKPRNSVLSGVFYLRAHMAEGDTIRFDGDVLPGSVRIPTYAPSEFNVEYSDIGADSGYLFLFPSTLVHQSMTSKDSVYICFQTYVFGEVGDEDELDHVRLS